MIEPRISISSNEIQEGLRGALWRILLPGSMAVGYLLIVASELFHWPTTISLFGLGVLLLPLFLWRVLSWSPRFGPLISVLSYLFICFLAALHLPIGTGLSLLILPTILATLLISPWLGCAFAAMATLWATTAGNASPINGDLVTIVSLILLWGLQAVTWALLHFLLETNAWAWSHYAHMYGLLENARKRQIELKQVQEDLVQANNELARLTERLNVMRQVAEQARQAKEEFVANVSHELRTPLNMILGISEMVTQASHVYGGGLPATLLADLDVIKRNSEHLARLVDDVLDLSHVESGRMALTREWVSLRELVDAAAVAIEPLFQSKGLYLQIQVAEELPLLWCDRTRIRQVLLNLLSNAGRFTSSGGVRLTAVCESGSVLVSVKDTGPGISLEDQPRLFEPFRQAGHPLLNRQKGTGLGLYVSKRFVEMHGGKMWMESQLGEGSTFYFTLPLVDPHASTDDGYARWFSPYYTYDARLSPSKAPKPDVRPRIGVVEQGTVLQRLLTRYQQEADIIGWTNLENALEEIRRVPVQALVVNDPNSQSLWPSSAQLVNLPYGIPAIACWVPGESDEADQLGVISYLAKPVSRERLLRAIEEVGRPIQSILVVDDEPDAVQLMSRMIGSAEQHYRILRAFNGARALALMRERQPDLVLLDLIMDKMSGYEVLKEKDSDPNIRGIPVIAVSAQTGLARSNAHVVALLDSAGIPFAELLACIRLVSAGQNLVPRPADPEFSKKPLG